MKRVSLDVAATGVVTSLAFIVLSAVPVYADANPNNHGHHYGQLKHSKASPAPILTPNPVPTPASTPAPVRHQAIVPVSQGANPAAGSTLPAPVSSPEPVTKVPVAEKLKTSPAVPDPAWWMLLTILPLLFAAWLIAFRRLLLGAWLGLRPAARMATAGAKA